MQNFQRKLIRSDERKPIFKPILANPKQIPLFKEKYLTHDKKLLPHTYIDCGILSRTRAIVYMPQKSLSTMKKPTIRPNKLYALLSPSLKIAMHVLEQGLFIDKNGKLQYDDSQGLSWLSKMGRELEGQVSRATIDEYLDTLLDERFLRHGDQEMQKVRDFDGTKWVRAYFVGNEFLQKIKDLYEATHDIKEIKTAHGKRK